MSASAINVKRISHWIGGEPVESTSGRTGKVWNPATGEEQALVDFASVAEVDLAVTSAKAAFPLWRATPLSRRAEVMFKFRESIDVNRRAIAEKITLEHGKTLADAMGEVARGLENVEFACGIPHLLKGGFSEQTSAGVDVYQIRQPLGVVAGITPFNFPAMVPMWMFANAIACGNTFVLKPSERDPSVSLLLAELLKQAGVPDGVFNVVQGDRAAVERLIEHPDVKAISFVGSTAAAKAVYENATHYGKRVQSLGGAKNHMLVLPDADIGMAADAAVSAAYGSAGERCMAISVVVAVGNVAEPLIEAIRERMAKIKIGPGLEASSEMGPLITREHRERVAAYVAGAAAEGATVVVDGRDHPASALGPHFYDDEVFGPFLTVTRVATYNEALCLVNENPYGNGTEFSRATAARHGSSSSMLRWEWLGSTSRLPCRLAITASVAGRLRCSAISTCAGRKASNSTHARRL